MLWASLTCIPEQKVSRTDGVIHAWYGNVYSTRGRRLRAHLAHLLSPLKDITPCTRAIEDILKLDSDCPPSVWGNLVRAGYIDRLCECVAGLRDALNYTSPAEERIAGTEPAVRSQLALEYQEQVYC